MESENNFNIFNHPLQEIKFEDVVSFCKQKVVENVTLEYKSDFPKNAKDLSKQFVTFSNTQGGIIIIGVDEDDKGLPQKFSGITNDGKLIDRIHQIAGNVLPLPNYEVAVTDEVKNKVFLIIRVNEGGSPPYATASDPTPWIRTGNVSMPVRSANREELLQLVNKKDRAEGIRNAALLFANTNFELDLMEADAERKRLIADGAENIYKYPLDSPDLACKFSISIIPFYPKAGVFNIEDLDSRLHDICGKEYFHTPFPQDGGHSIPGGYSSFVWNKNSGTLSSAQIYTNGHIYTNTDPLRPDRANNMVLDAFSLGHQLYYLLAMAAHAYKKVAYNGQLYVEINLSGGVGAVVTPPTERVIFRDNDGKIKFPSYIWPVTTDTLVLQDNSRIKKLHSDLFKDICWGLGLGNIHQSHVDRFHEVNGWFK